MADKAADLATRIIPHPKISNLPTNDIKSKIYSKWQNYWDAIPPTNKIKKLRKIQKNGSPLTTSPDDKKLLSPDVGSDTPCNPFIPHQKKSPNHL
jgi:hypothetical protein